MACSISEVIVTLTVPSFVFQIRLSITACVLARSPVISPASNPLVGRQGSSLISPLFEYTRLSLMIPRYPMAKSVQ